MTHNNHQVRPGFGNGFLMQQQQQQQHLPNDHMGYSTHLYAVNDSIRDGQPSVYSVTDWASSVSAAPFIHFPEPSIAGGPASFGASSVDRPFMRPAPPQPPPPPPPVLNYPHGPQTAGAMRGALVSPGKTERREWRECIGSGILQRSVDSLSSTEITAHDPALSVAAAPTLSDISVSSGVASVSSTETYSEGKVKRVAKKLSRCSFSLTTIIVVASAFLALLPTVAILPLVFQVFMPMERSTVQDTHQSQMMSIGAYLNSYIGYVTDIGTVTGNLLTAKVFNPEDSSLMSLACRLLTQVRTDSGIESIGFFSLYQSKMVMCAVESPSSLYEKGYLAGVVSSNEMIDNVYLLNGTTYEFVEPLQVVLPVGEGSRNVSDFWRSTLLGTTAVAKMSEALENGEPTPWVDIRECWAPGGMESVVFFSYPFPAYSSAEAQASGIPDDVGVVEVKFRNDRFAQIPFLNEVLDHIRVATFLPTNYDGSDPVVLSNNWGQSPVTSGEPCLWRWCEHRETRMRVSDITDESVQAAMKRLDLNGPPDYLQENHSDLAYSENQLFELGGALAAASLWYHVTPPGFALLFFTETLQRPITGPYLRTLPLLFCLAYIVPAIILVVLFGVFVDHILTKPLHAISTSINRSLTFGEDRKREDEIVGQNRRRTLNPLRKREKGDSLDSMDEEGDGYRNDELKSRAPVVKTGQTLRLIEMEGLQETFNNVMAQLRAADSYVPQSAAMSERMRFISTTSTWSAAEDEMDSISRPATPTVSTSSMTGSLPYERSPRAGALSVYSSNESANAFSQSSGSGGRGESHSSTESVAAAASQTSEHSSFTSHERRGSYAKGELSYVELMTTVVFIAPRDQNLLPTSMSNVKKRHHRTSFHAGKHGHFPSAFGVEQFFNNTSKFADRFGGVISSMTPELTVVMFNAHTLAVRSALALAPGTFTNSGARHEMETKAAAADAVAAVRFALTLQRCFERESRLVPVTQIMVDSSSCRLARYYSPLQRQNYMFLQGRDVYTKFGFIPLQLHIPISLTEETALMVWKEVRCIPVEAIQVERRAVVTHSVTASRGSVSNADSGGGSHVVLYEALRGSATSTAWCQYRDAYTAAFMPMLRGDYSTALRILKTIDSIADLEVALLPEAKQTGGESELLSTGGSARARRNRRPSAVTWKGVPVSHRDSASASTRQLDRMIAICARNVEKNIVRPYVHSVTVSGFIKRSKDLQDTPVSGKPLHVLAPPPLEVIVGKKKRRQRSSRQGSICQRALVVDGVITKTADSRSLLVSLLRTLPKVVEDSRGVIWELNVNDQLAQHDQATRNEKKKLPHRGLVALSPNTGAIASVEIRLLSELTQGSPSARSCSTSVNSSASHSLASDPEAATAATAATTAAVAGRLNNALLGLPQHGEGNCEDDGGIPAMRVADAIAAACPFLHPYYGHLICQPNTDAMILVAQFHRDDTLLDHMERFGRPLPLSFVLSVSLSILRGLEFLHANGRVHGDLRPENVLVASTSYIVPVTPGPEVAEQQGSAQTRQEQRVSVKLKGYVLAGTEGRYRTAGSAYAPPRYGTALPGVVVQPPVGGMPTGKSKSAAKHVHFVADTPTWDLFSFGLVVLTMARQSLTWECVEESNPSPQPENSDSTEEESVSAWMARLIAKGGSAFAREVGRGVFVLAKSAKEAKEVAETTTEPSTSAAVSSAPATDDTIRKLAEIAMRCVRPEGNERATASRLYDAISSLSEYKGRDSNGGLL